MRSLLQLQAVWPMLDEYHREGLRDFFARWTHSWVTYSKTMSQQDKDQLLSSLDQELSRRLEAMKVVYPEAAQAIDQLADESSQSKPSTNQLETALQQMQQIAQEGQPELPEE